MTLSSADVTALIPKIEMGDLLALKAFVRGIVAGDIYVTSGATASAAELNYNDITTLGTGAASKAVVLDTGEDYTWPATGVLTYGVLKDPAGTTITSTGAEINLLHGVTATTAELNYVDLTTLGTGAASKAVVLDAGEDYTWPATGVLTYGILKDPAGTSLLSTAAEIDAMCDVSTRLVDGSSNLNVTVALHAGKTITLGGSGASKTMTLPAAAGTGAIFRFVVTAINTSNHIITAATNSGAFYGQIVLTDVDATTPVSYFASGGSSKDVITLNGTTTGGLVGDMITIQDMATNVWHVTGFCMCAAGSNVATMFS